MVDEQSAATERINVEPLHEDVEGPVSWYFAHDHVDKQSFVTALEQQHDEVSRAADVRHEWHRECFDPDELDENDEPVPRWAKCQPDAPGAFPITIVEKQHCTFTLDADEEDRTVGDDPEEVPHGNQ